ncbi:MAG: Rap1a/Tai family immunity protein [Candidatus Methylophosphatis roskildensis]
MKTFLAGLLLLVLIGPVQAGGYYHRADALDQLRLAYDRNDPETKAAYFRGYVVGVADSAHGTAWCPPDNVSAERIQRTVSNYMKDHPATVSQDAAAVVTAALGASFPCKDK